MIGLRNKHINLYKSATNKLIYRQQYWMIASHQRLATSGQKDDLNTHPIVTEDFYVFHNGIFAGLGDREESDTVKYSKLLQENYNQLKDVAKAIQQTQKTIGGYYSVLIYHKGKGKLYYYKESGSSIYFIQDKEWFVLSTIKENIYYAKRFFRINEEIKTIDPNKLYDLFAWEQIATIEKEPQKTHIYRDDGIVTIREPQTNLGYFDYRFKKKDWEKFDLGGEWW